MPLNATLGGHKQNFVCTRNQEKGTDTLQENEPDMPVSVWESPAEARISSGCLVVRGADSSSLGRHGMRVGLLLLEEVTITPTIVES